MHAAAATLAAVAPSINRRGNIGDIFRGAFHPQEEDLLLP